MKLDEAIKVIEKGIDLTSEKAASAALEISSEAVPASIKKEFLIALANKGESATEIQGFSNAFRDIAINPGLEKFANNAIDVCGTGGDHSGSFNISSVVAMILAAAGIPVIKHGNRSITSQCGSAQFLEALGIKVDIPLDAHAKAMEALNFTFLFAPNFHPAFKSIMPVRQELAKEGKRSIFNILGPLINPAKPNFQLLGVYQKNLIAPMADALHQLGLKGGFVAHCEINDSGITGIDELTCAGNNILEGFGSQRNKPKSIDIESLNLKECSLSDLKGGSVQENIVILENILNGSAPKGLIETICLNAGTGIYITNRTKSIEEGINQSKEIIKSGSLKKWIEKAATFYQNL
jgi:anthranilate phosphoribosyltransferase